MKKNMPKDSMSAVRSMGEDIICSKRFCEAGRICHHKYENVADHSLRVAECGYRMASWLNRHKIRINEEDVVRGSLLHDIGMTDASVHINSSFHKWRYHPRVGEQIAADEYGANRIQLNAIRRHMWPLGGLPPRHRAGWVILASDKYCSIRERGGRFIHRLTD